ncbi:MAG TPA: methyltransferase domain-containing protein [Clostridiales bacterium]|jgi:tRNA G37 N-methylase Trm5|nr:methyltransferase domain-containing protein [Clostridiales bacterium]
MNTFVLRSARHLAEIVFEKVVRPGDRVVDATMGNGYDTLKLCHLVGDEGKVYAFDIQELALKNTQALLEANGLLSRAELFLCGHEKMKNHVAYPIKFCAFNLGWLPGSDKVVRTNWVTTKQALEQALSLLCPHGVCVLCVYPGHPEGKVEKNALIPYLSSLPSQEYNVLWQQFVNAGADAPQCIIIQKQTI